jgi:4-alpha-glucanotransferase
MNGLKISGDTNMSIDGAGPSPFPPEYRASACSCMSHHSRRSMVSATWGRQPWHGSINYGRPAKDGGKRYHSAPQTMASRLISRCLLSRAMNFSSDVLNLGTSARMNTPGQAGGNWRWRLTDDLLLPAAFDWLGDSTKQTNRSAVHSAAADRPRSEKPR